MSIAHLFEAAVLMITSTLVQMRLACLQSERHMLIKEYKQKQRCKLRLT